MTDVRPDLTPLSIVALVWRLLEAHPGCRPSVADIARATSMSVRYLRRALRRSGHEPLRNVITYGCLTWGWLLIAQGTKPTAASRLAGFRNHWNFNRQSRRWAGRSSKDIAQGLPDQLPLVEIGMAWRQLDGGPGSRASNEVALPPLHAAPALLNPPTTSSAIAVDRKT